MGKIIFVTGTDTGVGKTVLTAMLLVHLRAPGTRTLALKPFCSGGRGDAVFLHSFQRQDISLDQVNPFHFEKPLAPYLAAGRARRKEMQLAKTVQHIQTISRQCDLLLVEGAGGVLVPLGKNWFIRELIGDLNCHVIVVSRNALGTINHTLLTDAALHPLKLKSLKFVLMGQKKPDISAKTNLGYLQQVLAPKAVVSVEFLGRNTRRPKAIAAHARRLKKVLAGLVA